MGEMPRVVSASISSLTRIVPSCAANATPVRPAMTTAVIIAPISRVVATRGRPGPRAREPQRGARPARQPDNLDGNARASRARDPPGEKDEQPAPPLQPPTAPAGPPPVRRFPCLREDVRRDGWSRTE